MKKHAEIRRNTQAKTPIKDPKQIPPTVVAHSTLGIMHTPHLTGNLPETKWRAEQRHIIKKMIKPIIAVCSFFAVYAILTSYNGVPIDHDHALVFIIAHDESVNDANNYAGITQKKWEIWRSKQGDIRHLPRYVRELAGDPKLNPLKDPKVDITIIKRYYYDTLQRRWHAWDIHPALQLIYADFATLVGREAVKEVQKLVGVEADGQWGMGTADAVKAFNADFEAKRSQNPDYAWEVFLQFDAQKQGVFQSLAKENPEKYGNHLQKWLKRSNALKTYMQPVLTSKK